VFRCIKTELTELTQYLLSGLGMIVSTEQSTVIAIMPIRPHIATNAIVPKAKTDTLEFRVNTARIRKRIELFEKASAMNSRIRLVKKV
jgi:hypothetical protein